MRIVRARLLAALVAGLLLSGEAAHPKAEESPRPEASIGNATALLESREPLRRALHWLSQVSNLQGEFFQISSDGTQDQGLVWILRPDRARFEYSNQPITLLADGINWILYDREEKTRSEVLLSTTPFRFLLQNEPDLARIDVVRIADDAGVLEITLRDHLHPEHGNLTLEFGSAPFALSGWRIRDAQGTVTRVTLFNPIWNAVGENAPKPQLFRSPDPERSERR